MLSILGHDLDVSGLRDVICQWTISYWWFIRTKSVSLAVFERKKTSVYHTVNGDRALFHTSKTVNDKGYILRAPCQNVNVLLSNITFIIFAVFDV